MKTTIVILAAGAVVASFIAGSLYSYLRIKPTAPPPLTLEKILSIKELHLVRHTYTDLFFIHRKNNPAKNVRAIIQVPVEITAYLNLKEIEFIKQGDSIKQIVLHRAHLNTPHYFVDRMVVRETRARQLYAGRDLYAAVNVYLQQSVAQRQDSIIHAARLNHIIKQAEDEGLEYVTHLLLELGRPDIEVRFTDDEVPQVTPLPASFVQLSIL